MRAPVALGLSLGVAAALSAQSEPPAKSKAPVARIVRVDVGVTDARGRAIDNLKPDDFQLTEDGAAQTIEAARYIRTAEPGQDAGDLLPVRSEFDEEQEAARDGTRLLGIFLDEYHVAPGANTDRVRDALGRFVDRCIAPGDLVAVLKPLDSLLTIRATRDREQIRHAIETFEGRKGDYAPRNAFERNLIAGTPARIDQIRAQVTTSALNALVGHLGRLSEGRKAVLFVSEGEIRSPRRRGLESLPTFDTVIRSANRYTVSIYPFDPDLGASDVPPPARPASGRSSRAGPAAGQTESASGDDGQPRTATSETDLLRSLADATMGRPLIGIAAIGDVDRALAAIVADLSAYYLLTYRSARGDDGAFRQLEVRVKRQGARVSARKGYWALWPDEARAAEILARVNEPPRAVPVALALPWRTSPLIRPWFGVSRGADGRTRVMFVWEPAPRVPGERSRANPPARVELSAYGPDGTPLFEGPVVAAGGPDQLVAASGSKGADVEIHARATFDAPPGRVRLRMSIEDAASQVLDSDVREISIRDLKGPVALGTAEILRTRNAREFRAVSADPEAVPVAAREFSRAERLILRFTAYAPDLAAVSVRLVNRIGQTIRALDVQPLSPNRYQVDLPLASFAPGEYLIELTASSPAGEAKDLIGFRITS